MDFEVFCDTEVDHGQKSFKMRQYDSQDDLEFLLFIFLESDNFWKLLTILRAQNIGTVQ